MYCVLNGNLTQLDAIVPALVASINNVPSAIAVRTLDVNPTASPAATAIW